MSRSSTPFALSILSSIFILNLQVSEIHVPIEVLLLLTFLIVFVLKMRRFRKRKRRRNAHSSVVPITQIQNPPPETQHIISYNITLIQQITLSYSNALLLSEIYPTQSLLHQRTSPGTITTVIQRSHQYRRTPLKVFVTVEEPEDTHHTPQILCIASKQEAERPRFDSCFSFITSQNNHHAIISDTLVEIRVSHYTPHEMIELLKNICRAKGLRPLEQPCKLRRLLGKEIYKFAIDDPARGITTLISARPDPQALNVTRLRFKLSTHVIKIGNIQICRRKFRRPLRFLARFHRFKEEIIREFKQELSPDARCEQCPTLQFTFPTRDIPPDIDDIR